jgi:hypothetical protein
VLTDRNQEAVQLQRRGEGSSGFESETNGGRRAPFQQGDFGFGQLVVLKIAERQQQGRFIGADAGAVEPVDIQAAQRGRAHDTAQTIESPRSHLADAGGFKGLSPIRIRVLAVDMRQEPQAQRGEDEELGCPQFAELLGGVSVRRATCEHAELLVNLDIEATGHPMQMQIIRNRPPRAHTLAGKIR